MCNEGFIEFNEEIFEKIKSINKKVVLFGAGGEAAAVLGLLRDNGIYPICFCDNSKKLFGKKYLGLDVYSYDNIREKYSEYVLVISTRPIVAREIIEQLEEQNEENEYFNMCIPFKVDHVLLDTEKLSNYGEGFECVLNLMEDDISKQIFREMIRYKMTGDGINLLNYISGETFFDETLLRKNDSHVFVDVGAYTGDTIMRFCQFNGNYYDKIIGIELEKGNFDCLSQFVKYSRLKNVELHNVGGWSKKDKMVCYTFSKLKFENANLYKSAEMMMNNKKKKDIAKNNEESIELIMDVNSVDNILDGERATLIKVNAISADLEIIKGCEKTIRRWRPSFVLEYGCKPEHIIEIPMFLKNIDNSYRFYLRQKSIFSDSKTVLYVV